MVWTFINWSNEQKMDYFFLDIQLFCMLNVMFLIVTLFEKKGKIMKKNLYDIVRCWIPAKLDCDCETAYFAVIMAANWLSIWFVLVVVFNWIRFIHVYVSMLIWCKLLLQT